MYVNSAPHEYRRQRVELIQSEGSSTVIARGTERRNQGGFRRGGGTVWNRVRSRQVRALVAAALRLRWVVTVLSFLLLVVGFRLIQTTPLDVFPEFSPLLVEIQTEAPGLSTSEVESLVTTPIENALNGVKGLKTLRSKSVLGLSSVVLIFDEGAELMAARQLVQERLLTLDRTTSRPWPGRL